MTRAEKIEHLINLTCEISEDKSEEFVQFLKTKFEDFSEDMSDIKIAITRDILF